MELQSEIIEERRLFTYEERAAALKRSGGVCACCGKKLTTKTMTMDHIIPLSRGGSNEPENLIALCPECNKQKGNLLLMPRSSYVAVKNRNEMQKMNRHVELWFRSVRDQFELEKFPLIAPVSHLQLAPPGRMMIKKKMVYVPSLTLNWRIINADYYAEIEAVTGINIREIRKNIATINKHYKDDGTIPTVALYSLRKNSSDKILAVIAVQLCLDKRHMNIWLPWCEMPKCYQEAALYNFTLLLLDTVTRIAGYEILSYTLASTTGCKEVVHEFTQRALRNPKLGYIFEYMNGKDMLTEGEYQELVLVDFRDIHEDVRETMTKNTKK